MAKMAAFENVIGRRPTDARNQVVLQVKDPQVQTPVANALQAFNLLLVKRQLFQGEDLSFVVLRSAAHELFCD